MKKKIVNILRPILKDYGEFSFLDSPVEINKDNIPCAIISSSGPSTYEVENGIITVNGSLSLDIYTSAKIAPEIDYISEAIILAVLKDEGCDRLLQKISLKESFQKDFDGEENIHAIFFDFEVLYHLELADES